MGNKNKLKLFQHILKKLTGNKQWEVLKNIVIISINSMISNNSDNQKQG